MLREAGVAALRFACERRELVLARSLHLNRALGIAPQHVALARGPANLRLLLVE